MGIPAVVVQLDDGTGAWPYDVSSYVSLSYGGISWSRGRPDQFQTISPGQATVTLENLDGRFSVGAGGFGTGPYGSTPFGGGPSMGQGVRIKVAGQTRFSGRITSAPVSWPGGADNFSITTITAIDDLDKAARRRLGSSATEEILADAPAAYYPLDEAQGASFASDVTGNPQNPRLLNASLALGGSLLGGSVAFGTSLGLPDGSTGVLLTGQGLASELINVAGPNWISSNSLHFDIVCNAVLGASTPTAIFSLELNGATRVELSVSTAGVITFGGVITTGAVMSGGVTHVLSINSDATATDLWLDGVKIATGAGISGIWSNDICQLGDGFNLVSGASLTLGHLNFGTKLSDARVLAHHSALLTDFRGETPTARIARVAGYAGMSTGTLDTTSTNTMGPSSQSGRTVADILDDITQATQGPVFVDANGAISNVTGHTILNTAAPTATHDANVIAEDTGIEVDFAQVTNYIIGNAAGSANVTTALDAASIAEHGYYPPGGAQITWNVATDDQARDLTYWQINTYSQPSPRAPQIKYDALHMDVAGVLNALRLELGAFCSVTTMPSQTPGGDLYLIVEGVSETVTDSEWSITVNGVRHALTVAWILGDGFFGVLGSSTKLAY